MIFLKKKFFILCFLFLLGLTVTGSALASAPLVNEGVLEKMGAQEQAFVGTSGLSTSASIASIAAIGIKTVLGLLGIIFVILLIYAGYEWMTASGNEEKVSKAKETIYRAIIGLIIVVAAYSITYFVFNNLNKAAGGSGGTTQNEGGSSGR